LAHSWRLGQANGEAFLDDYACLAAGFLALYEATFDERWVTEAAKLMDIVLERFADPAGGFYYTSDRHETLIARQKDVLDSSVPSGNAASATALGKLGRLTGDARYAEASARTLQAAAAFLEQYPTGMGQMLLALDGYLGPATELVFIAEASSPETQTFFSELRRKFLPRTSVALRADAAEGSPSLDATFHGKGAKELPTLYVCSGATCQAPVSGEPAVRGALEGLATTSP
jgi:uncharacterized protein YyaL (SSP411 family)